MCGTLGATWRQPRNRTSRGSTSSTHAPTDRSKSTRGRAVRTSFGGSDRLTPRGAGWRDSQRHAGWYDLWHVDCRHSVGRRGGASTSTGCEDSETSRSRTDERSVSVSESDSLKLHY